MDDNNYLFVKAQSEFSRAVHEAEVGIQQIGNINELSERKKVVKNIQNTLKKADKALKSMQYDLDSPNEQTKANNQAAYNNHKAKLKSLKKVFKEEQARVDKMLRDTVAGYGMGDDDEFGQTSEDHILQLQKNTQLLAHSTKHIDDSLKMMEVSQDLLADTAAHVSHQGNQMRKMRDKVKDIQGEARSTGKIISRMSRRQIIQKLILVGIILLCLVIIALIVWFGFLSPVINKIKEAQAANGSGSAPTPDPAPTAGVMGIVGKAAAYIAGEDSR